MKRISTIISFGILMPTFFYLLEPIVTHTSGWSTLPRTIQFQPLILHTDETYKKADSLLKKIFIDIKTPGLSVAIGKNDTVIWANTIGYENIKTEKKISLTSKFRIGSTSKAITAMGLGILLQNKKLHLESTVKEYVPYANQKLSEITVKQLGSHTSGIRNYGLCFCFPIWEYYSNDEYRTVEESVAVFDDDALLFLPGTDFSYSTYNYTLLSAMIEGASKMSFPKFMKVSLFDPLELSSIDFERRSADLTNLSKFYAVENNEYKEVYQVNTSNKWAGGGMVASPTDLVALGNAFLNNTLLKREITTALGIPVRLKKGEINEQNYAIGWRNTIITSVFKDKREVQMLHHAGVANGATSVYLLFPEYNVTISFLINKNHDVSELFEYSYELAQLFM